MHSLIDEVLNGQHTDREMEVKDQIQAVITWSPTVYRIDTIRSVSTTGIYIVERNRNPVLVGVTWKASIGSRWGCRVDTFRELKIPAPTRRLYTIRVGTITGTGPWRYRRRRDRYESVERVIVRYLLRVRRYGLTNVRGRVPFTVAAPGIEIVNAGARPRYLPGVIRRAPGQQQEAAALPKAMRPCPRCGRRSAAGAPCACQGRT